MKKAGFIAIAGRPNAGKSTLLNFILGTKLSIVTPKAQTTRERLLGILTDKMQGQIVFIDTPGIHRAKEGGINQYMVQEAREALQGVSLVWYLVDPNSNLKSETIVLELIHRARVPSFLVMNKNDLKNPHLENLERDLNEAAQKIGLSFKEKFKISAKTGNGVSSLMRKSWELMPEGEAYFPDSEQISDKPLRYFAGERIREQLFHLLGEELPYSCAVEVEKFDEKSQPLRIEAVIYVERESQKGMVIGKGGLKIKAIGTQARKEIEEFLGGKIFLGLKVKVLKDWSKDAVALKQMGYALPQFRKSP